MVHNEMWKKKTLLCNFFSARKEMFYISLDPMRRSNIFIEDSEQSNNTFEDSCFKETLRFRPVMLRQYFQE